MKKTYAKPSMYVENFSLAQSIATACGATKNPEFGTPSYGDSKNCGWEIAGDVIWVQEPACGEFYPEDYDIGGVCYNNPNGGASIFSIS